MNRIDLEGRTAIVTGGAKGLGRAIVERLIHSGARVTAWDRDATALAAMDHGPQLYTAVVDVTDETGVETAMQDVVAAMGNLDILINNAGIGGPNRPVQAVTRAEWEQVFAVNTTGTFLCCRAAIPIMTRAGYGRIVNIASVAGKEGNADTAPYSASKAAVISLTKSLGKELARTGITVNCVTPAAIRTAILDNRTPEHLARMVDKVPMGRFGKPEELAAMVAWICSADASFTTGAVFDLSGGRATY